jgi:Anthranilate phosphoribosyltransferase
MQTLLSEALISKPVTSFDERSIACLMDELRAGANSSIVNAVSGLGVGAIDCCGTGGSGSAKFNTSTAAAFVLASAGLKVIKFGNRSASGSSGSVDFLMKCGLPTSMEPGAIKDIFERTNVLFLNARDVYPVVGSLAEIRKKFGKPSILNYIGPLLNPARPSFRLLGVSHPIMQQVLAEQLRADEMTQRAMVVRSQNNVDELEPDAPNHVIEFGRSSDVYELSYQYSGSIAGITSGVRSNTLPLVEKNFRSFATILNGFDNESRNYHSIVFNAAAGLVVAGFASTIAEGIAKVEKLIGDGVALRKFQEVRRIYRERA